MLNKCRNKTLLSLLSLTLLGLFTAAEAKAGFDFDFNLSFGIHKNRSRYGRYSRIGDYDYGRYRDRDYRRGGICDDYGYYDNDWWMGDYGYGGYNPYGYGGGYGYGGYGYQQPYYYGGSQLPYYSSSIYFTGELVAYSPYGGGYGGGFGNPYGGYGQYGGGYDPYGGYGGGYGYQHPAAFNTGASSAN